MNKDLLKLVRFAQKHGLKRVKSGDLEIEFSGPVTPKQSTRKPVQPGDPLASDMQMPGDDAMLYWSTETYDLMQAQRKEALKENN